MYSERSLFGGAIVCDVPTSWRDVSDVRQVPDHQEVWQDATEDGAMLVVEILERQDVDDANAACFFFDDLAESNGIAPQATTSSDLSFRPVTSTHLPPLQIEGATACAGIGYQKIAVGREYNAISGQRREDQEIRWTCVELCVLRLARVETDLLVTVTKPMANPKEPPPMEAAAIGSASVASWSEPFQRSLSSMQIRDWQLFG